MAYKIIREAHILVSVDDNDEVTGYRMFVYPGIVDVIGPNEEELNYEDHGWDISNEKIVAIEKRTECAFEKLTDLAENMLPDGELKVIPLKIEGVP